MGQIYCKVEGDTDADQNNLLLCVPGPTMNTYLQVIELVKLNQLNHEFWLSKKNDEFFFKLFADQSTRLHLLHTTKQDSY